MNEEAFEHYPPVPYERPPLIAPEAGQAEIAADEALVELANRSLANEYARQNHIAQYILYTINDSCHFEYDPANSATNKAKHGIDFDEAQALWKDARMLEAPAKTDDEPRVLVIGKIGENHWAAVCAPSWGHCADHLGAARPETGDRSL